MKLSARAKANGLAYKTAWRMWRDGRLPIPAEQLPTGTVIVHPPPAPSAEAVALYARVASADQKADLERQLGRLADDASRERLTVIRSVPEIGSGPNGHRAKVMRLLAGRPGGADHRRRAPRPPRAVRRRMHRGGPGGGRTEAGRGGPGREERRPRAGHGGRPHVVLRPSVWPPRREEPGREGVGRRGHGRRRVILAHKIALDPTQAQAEHFARACGVARFAWNWGLARWR